MATNSSNDRPAAGDEGTVAHYRFKAELCQRMAAESADPEMRDQWLQLANQWTYLVLHANQREIEPGSRTRTSA